jgi:predicted anti-sigma-YlaC factor YlaD
MSQHWTEEQLLEHLYGLRNADEHLTSCPECSSRFAQMSTSRKGATEPPEIPDDFLAAQRRRIHERIGSPLRSWRPLRWAVPLMAVFAIVFGLTIYHSMPTPQSHDDQFFSEISTMAQTPTPKAVQPIEALVDEDMQE